MDTTNHKTWGKAVLSVGWQADRHSEHHSIVFQRPTADNPSPQYPVVAGELLSKSRLPMSERWGGLYAPIRVEAFDEYSMTIRYGTQQYVIKPEDKAFSFGEKGMDYTSFSLWLSLKTEEESPLFTVTHDETFLRRFRTRERVMRLTDDDVKLLRREADKDDLYAQYGLGRWLYYNQPDATAMAEAEQLFLATKKYLPDALAAYAMMWRYGETKENTMNLKESNKLLQAALKRDSERAAQQQARFRIYGLFRDAEPEQVAREIEQRLAQQPDSDPHWHTLLAYAYEQLDRQDDAIRQYELSTAQGELDDYFSLACIYLKRGNIALYDSLMEKGILEGSGLCCVHGADMDEEDFRQLSNYQGRQHHEQVEANLRIGLKRGEGWCAYYLWYLSSNHLLAFSAGDTQLVNYLKQGVRLGNTACMTKVAQLAEDGEWPEVMSARDIGELWLRAARYSHDDEEALRGLSRVSDPAFLLKHKEELKHFWRILIQQQEEEPDDDGRYDAWA